jgi:hypothetical protein
MLKSGFDAQALVDKFSEASATQGEALRKAVGEATLKALQGRELTLKNIKETIKGVTAAASKGAASNPAPAVDVEAMLTKAFSGMDAALLQAVEANRRALAQLVEQGANLREGQMKKALADVEKLEDTLFGAIEKAMQSVPAPLQTAWSNVLEAGKAAGTGTGGKAQATVAQLTEQARTSVRDGRELSLKAAQAMLDSYSALVSGVLIGMSQGLQGKAGSDAAPKAAAKPAPAARASRAR